MNDTTIYPILLANKTVATIDIGFVASMILVFCGLFFAGKPLLQMIGDSMYRRMLEDDETLSEDTSIDQLVSDYKEQRLPAWVNFSIGLGLLLAGIAIYIAYVN